MFKVSLLLATSGTQPSSGPASDKARPSKQAGLHPTQPQSTSSTSALKPRDWSIQAAAVTDGLLDASKYKSLAVYAEVKLTEALDKAAQALPDVIDKDGQLVPNSLKVAVCCQLLGELAELCGPFSGTLLKLRDELLPALYSSYAAAQTGMPLQFDQMPWFMVANQLQCQNQALLDQQEAFKAELSKHQAQMVAVEQQLLAFKAAMDAGGAAAIELELTNASLMAARDSAVEEAAAAADESKRLAAEVTRLKDDVGEMQEALMNAQEVAGQDMEQWQGQLEAFKKQLHVEKQEREAAVALAVARLTLQEGQELEQRCIEAERRLEDAEQKLAAVGSGSVSDTAQLQLLTPRPTDWGQAQELADTCKATSETVRQLLQQHSAAVAALQRQLQLQQALAQPDPAPRPWDLSLRTETSTYFITEGGLGMIDAGTDAQGAANSASKPKLFADALGLGVNVPRFLRWDEAVEVQDMTCEQLQQQISSIWQGMAEHAALHGPCHLQTYLYHYCMAEAYTATTPRSAAAVEAAIDSASALASETNVVAGSSLGAAASCTGSTSPSSGSTAKVPADAKDVAAQLTSVAQASAAAGYQLYYSLTTHRRSSIAADTMWHVLTGLLPESVLQEQQQQVQGLLQVLYRLSAGAANSSGAAIASAAMSSTDAASGEEHAQQAEGLSVTELSTTLRLLYPLKQPQQLAEIVGCLEAACRSCSSRQATTSTVINSANVQVQHVALVAAVLRQQAWTVLHCNCADTSQQEQHQQSTSEQQVTMGSSACTSTEVTKEAVQQLLECLGRQHLKDGLSHTQQVVQRVQQLLTGGGSTPGIAGSNSSAGNAAAGASGQVVDNTSVQQLVPAADAAVWHEIASLLKQQLECNTSESASSSRALASSRQASTRQRQVTTNGIRSLGGSINERYSAAVDTSRMQGVSLVATAAASRSNSIGNKCRALSSEALEDKSLGSSRVNDWLAAVQRVPPGKLQVQQLLQWLQRQCMLVPPSCRQNAAAALPKSRWCKSLPGGSAATAAGAPGVEGLCLPDGVHEDG